MQKTIRIPSRKPAISFLKPYSNLPKTAYVHSKNPTKTFIKTLQNHPKFLTKTFPTTLQFLSFLLSISFIKHLKTPLQFKQNPYKNPEKTF
jgi:hypothetical protein